MTKPNSESFRYDINNKAEARGATIHLKSFFTHLLSLISFFSTYIRYLAQTSNQTSGYFNQGTP